MESATFKNLDHTFRALSGNLHPDAEFGSTSRDGIPSVSTLELLPDLSEHTSSTQRKPIQAYVRCHVKSVGALPQVVLAQTINVATCLPRCHAVCGLARPRDNTSSFYGSSESSHASVDATGGINACVLGGQRERGQPYRLKACRVATRAWPPCRVQGSATRGVSIREEP
jgi:hypothetical protein